MTSKAMKRLVAFFAVMCAVPVTGAAAMHIMEGYLPAGYCVMWGILCVPFLIWGGMSMTKQMKKERKIKIILAMAGAFVFVISSLKIPSVTGSCSHPTGTGLGAVLFGAPVMSILGIIVLLFQALLLAHGGITTLGANTFSMAIAGPFVSWGIFALCKKLKVNRAAGVFLACTIGDLFTYCVTSLQLALAFPDPTGGIAASAAKFMAVFAPTQLPIAIAEGILSVMIYNVLANSCKQELAALKVI